MEEWGQNEYLSSVVKDPDDRFAHGEAGGECAPVVAA